MERQILILTTTHDFLWKFERENVKILQKMGYTVHFATNMREPQYLSYADRIRDLGVLAHHIDIARSPFLFHENQKALRQLITLIRTQNIQIIHCHTPVGGLLGRLAGKICRKQKPVVIYTAHGFHFYKGAPLFNHMFYYPVEKMLARLTDILIVINAEDFKIAKRFHLKKGGRIFKIPGVGLDTAVFYPFSEEKRAVMRQKLGVPADVFLLVSVGELNENKNQMTVLKALQILKNTTKQPLAIRYFVCGDGFFRPQLETAIDRMELASVVTLCGWRDPVADVVGCADAMIFPSRREGLGMAGLEALAMGVPVIAADNRGTREYMEHGENGFVYRYDDAAGFAKGIETMQNMDAAAKREMQKRCCDAVKPFDRIYARAVMRRIYAIAGQKISENEQKRVVLES